MDPTLEVRQDAAATSLLVMLSPFIRRQRLDDAILAPHELSVVCWSLHLKFFFMVYARRFPP